VSRRRPNPASWARLSDEEITERAREQSERERPADIVEGGRSDPRAAGAGGVTEESTRVTGRRIIAHVVDGLIIALIALVLLELLRQVSDVAAVVVYLLALLPGQVLYWVLTQRKTGQSPGKKLCRIKVVDQLGNTPTVPNLVRRSIPLLIEYLYLIALAAILSSPYRQRLGDRWAHTYVVAA